MDSRKKRESHTKSRASANTGTPSQASNEKHLLLWIIFLIVALAIFLQLKKTDPWEKEVRVQCSAPSIFVDGRCCVDTDANGVCDDLDRAQEESLPARPQPAQSSSSPPLVFSVKSVSSLAGSEPVLLGGVVSADDDPMVGNPDAQVTIIEFGNYECIPCGYAYRSLFPKIEENYIKTGKAKYIFRDFAPREYDKRTNLAAHAANCANEHGKFWQMHDLLFSRRRLARADLVGYAQELGMSTKEFNECLDTKYGEEIEKDYHDAKAAGLKVGIPVFFVNGIKVASVDYGILSAAIENVLSGRWK